MANIQATLLTFLEEPQINADVKRVANSSLANFNEYDKSGDGKLSFAEFQKVGGHDAKRTFNMMDLDQNASISKEEYIKYKVLDHLNQQLMSEFRAMDKNKDGTLTKAEVEHYLKEKKFPPAEISRLVAGADTNHDGKINYAELHNSELLLKLLVKK